MPFVKKKKKWKIVYLPCMMLKKTHKKLLITKCGKGTSFKDEKKYIYIKKGKKKRGRKKYRSYPRILWILTSMIWLSTNSHTCTVNKKI